MFTLELATAHQPGFAVECGENGRSPRTPNIYVRPATPDYYSASPASLQRCLLLRSTSYCTTARQGTMKSLPKKSGLIESLYGTSPTQLPYAWNLFLSGVAFHSFANVTKIDFNTPKTPFGVAHHCTWAGRSERKGKSWNMGLDGSSLHASLDEICWIEYSFTPRSES